MKVLTVVGARPQFIKASAISRVLRKRHQEVLLHTGQHYDDNLSGVFFKELEIPEPDYHLGVGSSSHGAQTGAMLSKIEAVLMVEKPDWVLVYGDTNSTLAGALAAAKLHLSLAHVESGLRSYNRQMPEEINRVLTDHVSSLLLCPSQTAVRNLAREGITTGVHEVGDVMADALLYASGKSSRQSEILSRLGLKPRGFLLVTVHRAENTEDTSRLAAIIGALKTLADDEPVVFPVHPRTRKALESLGLMNTDSNRAFEGDNLKLTAPVGYLDMVMLEQSARIILTDSGGIQKEAYWLGRPCITLRDETEWTETVEAKWNVLVGSNAARIKEAVRSFALPTSKPSWCEHPGAASRCIALMEAGR